MATIKARPVGRVGVPRYPSRLEVDSTPELLLRHQPPAWLGRREMAGALAACLAVSANGCSRGGRDAVRAPAMAVVAPVFEHGDGRASTGCVVANPPTFLSESEALQIIRERLEAVGLTFFEADVAMPEVVIPPRKQQFAFDWVNETYALQLVEAPGKGTPLQVDLKDSKRHVAIEYVTREDHDSLGGPPPWMSVRSYDFKEIAQNVKKHTESDGKGVYLGLFYDPGGRVDQKPIPGKTAAETSRQLLRAQVKDFVDWLKAQGVI